MDVAGMISHDMNLVCSDASNDNQKQESGGNDQARVTDGRESKNDSKLSRDLMKKEGQKDYTKNENAMF